MRGGHLQAGSRGRAADESQQHGERAQHEPGPSRRDLAEQAMFDGIPLRCSRRIVADGDRQPGFVREILESLLETPRPRRVAPAGIRLDHQTFCLRIIRPMQTPPVGDGIYGQVRRVARRGHAHMPLVSLRIVNSVLRRAALGVLGKVVGVDFLRFFPPRLPGVLEIPHQFLFLGVHADSRVARAAEFFALCGDVAELSISLGVRLARVQHLAMAAQAVALLPQQAADRWWDRPGDPTPPTGFAAATAPISLPCRGCRRFPVPPSRARSFRMVASFFPRADARHLEVARDRSADRGAPGRVHRGRCEWFRDAVP